MRELALLEPAEPRYEAPGDRGPWRSMSVGDPWGGRQQWAYFRAKAVVPADWPSGPIQLHLAHEARYLESPADDNYAAGPEGQVFIDDQRVGAIDAQHHWIQHAFERGGTADVRAVFFAARCACRHELKAFELALIDPAARKLYHDLRIALDSIDLLDEASVPREKLIRAVEAAMQALDFRTRSPGNAIGGPGLARDARDPDGSLIHTSVPAAQAAFDRVAATIRGGDEVPHVVAVGHAHIDLGWLWPMKQTRHKCVRTFATQCRLLDQFDDWVFQQSSPQAYEWVEQDAPDLFARVREQVRSGRWEADGAMWCESDTNLPSGESLVRQLLYGKRYFHEKLGVDSRMLWLPDVFGYSAALPQLLKLAGVDGFVTSKISWSQYNRFPHDTFRWRGIDGTDLPTHFITTPYPGAWFLTYNATMTAGELKANWDEYRQKRLSIEPLMTFGYGDGGGGPTEEMLESAQRLARGPAIAGLPRVRHEKAGALMQRIAARAKDLPVWDGELYLEYHRGTYTTQAWLKRANRKNEIALHNLEWLACLARPHGFELDKPALDRVWQDILLMQFHDILPGSSVGELYDEVRPLQEHCADQIEHMTNTAVKTLVDQIDCDGRREPLVMFNTLGWERNDPLRLPDGRWIDRVGVPPGGWKVIDAAAQEAACGTAVSISTDGRTFESQFWLLCLDADGRIATLHDKRADRHVLPEGALANQWQVFCDRPMAHDAWDIDDYYGQFPLPPPRLDSIRIVEQGPVRTAVQLVWHMPLVGTGPRSVIRQTMALYANHPRIDFETRVEWHEHHQLLKVAFPVEVRATDATYQVQFGHVRRPTHRNTSWDFARFECCGHQFVNLSEHDYGVALLNDCKYGHDVHENVIRLTCIKCPQSPHAEADQGQHAFTYALLPHAGSFQEALVVRAAAELNNPLRVCPAGAAGGTLPDRFAFVCSDCDAAVVDTIKPAEDGDGTILRLYEAHGSHAAATLKFAVAPARVVPVNLLEEPREEGASVIHDGPSVTVPLRPFQIVSLRVCHPH